MEHTSRTTSPKRRAKFLVGGAVVAGAVLGLVGWALSRPEATSFYLTVREVRAMGATPPGRDFRVNGVVVPGTIERRGLTTTFAIAAGGDKLTVTTDQPLPDAFRSASEVVARGRYDGDRFAASEVLAKCPSKFEAA
jgi:cytochrome c-type biogenesis protein CcmE